MYVPPEQCTRSRAVAPADLQHRQFVNVHRDRLQLHRDLLPRQFVGAPAVHLLCRDLRRGLQELAAERLQRGFQRRRIDRVFDRVAGRLARRGRRCWWTTRNAPRPRKSCRCACRTAPAASPCRSPAAARRSRSGPASPGARSSWYSRCGAFCRPHRARSSPRAYRLR